MYGQEEPKLLYFLKKKEKEFRMIKMKVNNKIHYLLRKGDFKIKK